jgi:flagellar biosynthesis/type III secretory pathway protein FliH
VDAEEKKLSASAGTDGCDEPRSGFRLHYFPDIPLDDPDNSRNCISLKENFQRIRFDNQNRDFAEPSDQDDSHGREQEEVAASADRFDVDAYQKGFNDGLDKGTVEGERRGFECASKNLEPLLDSFRIALLQLKNLRAGTLGQIEKEVVELAIAIARKVVCREIEMDREIVLYVAREALSRIDEPGKITIKMSPQDFEFINAASYKLSDEIGNIDNVSLEAADNIQSGGCIIETSMGEIDARIENQIHAVEESFRKAIEQSAGEE